MFCGFLYPSTAHIPEYILIFDAIINGIVFLILFLHYLCLMYRNKIEFCILLISSNSAELISSKHTQKHTNGIEVQENCVCCILGTYHMSKKTLLIWIICSVTKYCVKRDTVVAVVGKRSASNRLNSKYDEYLWLSKFSKSVQEHLPSCHAWPLGETTLRYYIQLTQTPPTDLPGSFT